jgi:hypothetical protein
MVGTCGECHYAVFKVSEFSSPSDLPGSVWVIDANANCALAVPACHMPTNTTDEQLIGLGDRILKQKKCANGANGQSCLRPMSRFIASEHRALRPNATMQTAVRLQFGDQQGEWRR